MNHGTIDIYQQFDSRICVYVNRRCAATHHYVQRRLSIVATSVPGQFKLHTKCDFSYICTMERKHVKYER